VDRDRLARVARQHRLPPSMRARVWRLLLGQWRRALASPPQCATADRGRVRVCACLCGWARTGIGVTPRAEDAAAAVAAAQAQEAADVAAAVRVLYPDALPSLLVGRAAPRALAMAVVRTGDSRTYPPVRC
jgi:hypothetical protein